jgi:hypothetical protein
MAKVAIALSMVLTLGFALPPAATERIGSLPDQATSGLGCCL